MTGSTNLEIIEVVIMLFRSSHRRCSVKKGARKNFAIYAGKRLCWSLFNKVAGLKATTCATTDTAHAQISYPTVAELSVAFFEIFRYTAFVTMVVVCGNNSKTLKELNINLYRLTPE